ncbi:tudor domain-containing protein 15 [Xenopus laevis]|uniref:Tudor domain-containing protein 15 n=2 Tax=Xenopus laevis TaxID=8355 RepID=A0A1L8G5C1_XENLA|nr:tudor domain-containing protein 15 [Xenopus laevis]XP_018121455.1 tudor domain-containing protein 15 [Xenopus laevis]OCT79026.1 hypothetical protein XELAEV_18030122mg [Xenopus laevis]
MDIERSAKSLPNGNLKIVAVACHPDNVIIKFQGKYNSGNEFDYHVLQNEIQLVPKVQGDIGNWEFCLVQDKAFGVWQRGKVLNKINEKYEVFLIDHGNTVNVDSTQIASASKELFSLGPRAVNGIFSGILPVKEKWTPKAVNYFSSLVGLQVEGHDQAVLPGQVTIVEVPTIVISAVELNLARYIDSTTFCLLAEVLHKCPLNYQCKQLPDLLQQKTLYSSSSQSLHDDLHISQKILDHLRPDIVVGTTEKIKISAAVSYSRFYCHLLSWEEELNNLTTLMFSHYETITIQKKSILDHFGVLCAAKRKDGLWHRGIIETFLSGDKVQIWFIDIGCRETISSSFVQKLKPEFLTLPMMAIPCSLKRMTDHADYATNIQLTPFKQFLLGNTVIATFEQFGNEERLFHITLQTKDYELNENCHLTNQSVPVFSPSCYRNLCSFTLPEKPSTFCVPDKATTETIFKYKTIQMNVDSVYVGHVEYVLNPSNFCIRTDELQNEFSVMMEKIAKIYNPCGRTERVIKDPKPGDLCCALYNKDRHYYRAVVTDVLDLKFAVYFLDSGNTETVPFYDVKILLPEFEVLPALAMCCSLAYVYPLQDVWVMHANDFFKQKLSGKALLFHVLAKQKHKYFVDVQYLENSENSNIVTMMVEAGYAEYWKVNLNPSPVVTKSCPTGKSQNLKVFKQNETKVTIAKHVSRNYLKQDEKSKFSSISYQSPQTEILPITFKEYLFNPGSVVDVKCSHVNSPKDFWCQLLTQTSELEHLMKDIQSYYSRCNDIYKHGQKACIVKCASTGTFYRAAVHNVAEKEVDVILVDYGYTKRAFISDLREIKPQFITLKGQAFRCCLNSFITPVKPHLRLTSEACRDFIDFVNSSVTENLKCTVHALFSIGSTNLFNAVSLETRFTRSQFLLEKGHATLSHSSVPFITLCSFCYSDFNIRVGSLELVYITHIYRTGKFYCQLARNTEAIEALMKKVSEIGEQNIQTDCTRENKLCIVKYYEDGNFYRALAHPIESSSLFSAFFVDFGNSQMVTKKDLLPIPDTAVDLLREPMQAIQFYLAGLKNAVLTEEVKQWLDENCLGKPLNAVVSDRDCDNQLVVKLYKEKLQINQKVKELLGYPPSGNTKVLSPQLGNGRNHTIEEGTSKKQTEQMTSQELKRETLSQIDEIPTARLVFENLSVNQIQHNTAQNPVHQKDKVALTLLNNVLTIHGNCFNCSDLPTCPIEPLSKAVGYISHINSPSSFYIQLSKNENAIVHLAEQLNKQQMSFQALSATDCKKGMLVAAEYPDDLSFYRAEILEVRQDKSFEVAFIDYGNTANLSSLFLLPDTFLSVPKLSISASLSGIEALTSSKEWSQEVISYFSQKVNGKSLYCTFLEKNGMHWKVSLICSNELVADDLIKHFPTHPSSSKLIDVQNHIPELCIIIGEAKNKITNENETREIQDQYLKPGQIEKVKNIYFADCGRFFVNLGGCSLESNLMTLIADAVKKTNNSLAVKNITKGIMCLAKSEKMNMWLRASVQDIFPKTLKMLVFYVDHGAHEVINMHNAKVLSSKLLQIPKQAIACRWAWNEKIESQFQKVLSSLMEKDVQILFLKFLKACQTWKVEVLVNGSLLMEYFNATKSQAENTEKNHVPSSSSGVFYIPETTLERGITYSGFVTAVYEPSDFYFQLEDSVDLMSKLLILLHKISDYILPLPCDLLKPGVACLLKCFAGNTWCRSKIIKIENNSILLNLVDYGVFKNIPFSDVAKLKCIPESLACLPSLTYRCMLHGVKPCAGSKWSKDAITFFTDFVKEHFSLFFQCAKNKSSSKLEVNIYGQGSLSKCLVSMGFAEFTETGTTLKSDSGNMPNGLLKSNTTVNLYLQNLNDEHQDYNCSVTLSSCAQKNSKEFQLPQQKQEAFLDHT